MEISVPIVDITPWVNDANCTSSNHAEIAAKWNNAMCEFGCAILIGHGVPESVFDKVNEECREFFQRTLVDKQSYNHGIYGNPLGGYTAPGNEIVALSCEEDENEEKTSKPKFDPVENFVFTSHPSKYKSPGGEPSPFESSSSYYERMEATLNTIHSLSCAALGVEDTNYFRNFYDPNLPGNEKLGINGNALRLAHYPPINPTALHAEAVQSSGDFDDKVRYGAHTDYQGFTILRPDKSDWHIVEFRGSSAASQQNIRVQCGGLEVFHRATEQWIQVRIPEHLNALVVNAGDLIQRWTNDYWHSPLHRVVTASATTSTSTNSTTTGSEDSTLTNHTTADNTATTDIPVEVAPSSVLPRQAIVFFTGPLEDCVINSLDPALMRNVSWNSAMKKYPPIRSGDHLMQKINKTNLSDVK